MRNAFTAGVLHTLWRLGLRPEQVAAIYACSSANGVATFFLTEQLEESFRIWTSDLLSLRAFNPLRPLRGRPMGDIHWTVDEAMKSLNRGRLGEVPTKLIIGVMELGSGWTRHRRWNIEQGDQLIKASGAMPRVTPPIFLNSLFHIDGGVHKPLPFKEAVEREGKAYYLVISNRPDGYQDRPLSERFARWFIPDSEPSQRALLDRSRHLAASWESINSPPNGVKVFSINAPSGFRCCRFERRRYVVNEAIEQGRLTALQSLKQGLASFLKEAAGLKLTAAGPPA